MAVMDEYGQEIRAFIADISRAHHMKQDELEVSERILEYYNPNGMGDSEYFIFQNVKVYPRGHKERIKLKEAITLEEKLHNSKGAIVGRTS